MLVTGVIFDLLESQRSTETRDCYKLVILVTGCPNVLRDASASDRFRRVGVPATLSAATLSLSTDSRPDSRLLDVASASA